MLTKISFPSSLSLFLVISILLIFFFTISPSYKDQRRWSHWGFGDAQAIFSAQHWARDGFLAHKFLPLPSPYSLITKYLDDPELRHHAHGSRIPGLTHRIKYYTHYPFGAMGFLVAVLMKLGIQDKYYFHLTYLALSLMGVFLFYSVVSLLLGKFMALISLLFYLFTPIFYNYAASLSNISLDNFSPWFNIWLYLLILKGKEYFKIGFLKINLFYLLNLSFFLYSFFSIDYILFTLLVMIATNIFLEKRIIKRDFLIFVFFYSLGLILHLIQNALYLGWLKAMGDFINASRVKGLGNFLNNLKYLFLYRVSIESLIGLSLQTYLKSILLIISGILIYPLIPFKKKLKMLKILVILHLAGAALFFVFAAIKFNFLARLYLPEILMVYLSFLFIIFHFKKNIKRLNLNFKLLILSLLAILLVLLPEIFLWQKTIAYFCRSFGYFKHLDLHAAYDPMYELGDLVKNMGTPERRIIFFNAEEASDLKIFLDKSILQVYPIVEYYFAAPVFILKDNTSIVLDVGNIFKREKRMLPVIITKKEKNIEEILNIMGKSFLAEERDKITYRFLKYNGFLILSVKWVTL